jgi:hypothetical protein
MALIENPEKFQYKEITKKEYSELKKKNKIKGDHSFFVKDYYIRVVSIAAKDITTEDFLDSYLSAGSEYYKTPEMKMMDKDSMAQLTEYRNKYNSMGVYNQKSLLTEFIEQNKLVTSMKEEVKQAKEMLKAL